ncbi:Mediator of RNA polymerase II transcription subunit 6 [Cucumispora dikerogammari]|nr:Mediator of RNA polymerase II transcription subunit 6 [Cucumispora dikerogammari]
MDVKFKNEEFLQQFFLTKDNVLEYFYTSPFFDTSSNNAMFRNQTKTVDFETIPGKYYELYFYTPQNNLFIILEKLNKTNISGKNIKMVTSTTNGFYILNNEISTCPTNYNLFEKTIVNFMKEVDIEMKSFVKNREICFFEKTVDEKEKKVDFIEKFLESKHFLYKK